MHPLNNSKWKCTFVLSNNETVTHFFGSEKMVTEYIKSVLSGTHLLRKRADTASYSVFPASMIIEIKVEQFVDDERQHYTGPYWNV